MNLNPLEKEKIEVMRPTVDDFGSLHNLSPREKEILGMAACGYRTKEISHYLGCAIQTIGTYWARIYLKTRSTSRENVIAQLLRFAVGIKQAGK